MKPRYLGFRVLYAVQHKLGVFKFRFPKNPPFKVFINKTDWDALKIPFFIPEGINNSADTKLDNLRKKSEKILKHTFTFFGSTEFYLGDSFDWITNPENGYKYNLSSHWSEIADLSESAGDIKYVWEKARFTFIYDIIRYDHHFKKNNSRFIFAQIEDFIDKNPVNLGPNYKCSQEISLRILNWTYALSYYSKNSLLTDELFKKIINSIYWQLKHVYKNINFSRIAVRNNHAITETSMLYLSFYLYPFFKESKKWTKNGRKWLLQEIDYQIYDDGSYLQFSHNYHRVVVQTLSWVLRINQLHNISFPYKTNQKLTKTLDFLYQHQELTTGWLPNYGNNDGALFFPLNSNHFRDFRPQLQVFGLLIGRNLYNTLYEDAYWFNIQPPILKESKSYRNKLLNYKIGGFFGFRDNALTTIRCGVYKDRPFQADALHLDIWHNGINVFFDPGTYKYNTEAQYLEFYNGTRGHNTLTIGYNDQMLKGGRFIWFYWTKRAKACVNEYDDRFEFEGEIEGFPKSGKGIIHSRKVIKYKNEAKWKVFDRTNYSGNDSIALHWNVNPSFKNQVDISSIDSNGNKIEYSDSEAWNSIMYGTKESFKQKICILPDGFSETTIRINNYQI